MISEPKRYNDLVVECDDCGFIYAALHELQEGGYDCPNCNEALFAAEKRANDDLIHFYERYTRQQTRVIADQDREIARLRKELEEIYKRDCALAMSHGMECHRKDYARKALGGGGE